jgi:hypothetical protein
LNYQNYINVEKIPAVLNFVLYVSNFWLSCIRDFYDIKSLDLNVREIFVSKCKPTVNINTQIKNKDETFLTLIIQLNDNVDFEGGEILFDPSGSFNRYILRIEEIVISALLEYFDSSNCPQATIAFINRAVQCGADFDPMDNIYSSEYTGYVYIWYDTKSKFFYIGGHYGKVDDAYIYGVANSLKHVSNGDFDAGALYNRARSSYQEWWRDNKPYQDGTLLGISYSEKKIGMTFLIAQIAKNFKGEMPKYLPHWDIPKGDLF